MTTKDEALRFALIALENPHETDAWARAEAAGILRAAIDEALAQTAPTPDLPPLPDERAAFEDLLDAAEEWERFVDVDRAPMNLRKWLERAALAQHSAETSEVRALREENARLRGDCVEWLCARCQTIHPSQRGRTFLQPCPECGEAMEPTSFNIRALKRMDALIEAARLGLEALSVATTPLNRDRQIVLRAISALRAALPEQKERN